MCAFKNHNPPKRDSSPSAILSRNKHSHPALKQLHDQAFGFNADTGSPLGLGAKDRLGSLQSEFGSSSNPGTPTRSTTPGGGVGGENDTSSLGGKSSSKKTSKRNHRSNQSRQNSLLKHKLDSIPPNLQGFYQNANHRHTRHHHNHHHHHAHHGSPFAGPYENFSRHALSKDNLSVQNLSSLGRMVDDRTGYNEDKRVSDEDLNQISKQKNGKGLREYYERLNSILDSWREVDEILDSKFPEEVMLRFGSVEEVESFNKRKRLPWLDGEGESDASESGYQEESEESDDEARQRNGKSSFARAASAISGLWFGASSTPPVNKYSYNSSQRDEEQGLLSSSASGTPVKERRAPLVNKRYGATGASFGIPGSGLTTIADDNMEGGTSSTVSATNNTSQPSLSAKERNDRFSQSPPQVGTVRSTSPSGQTPKALENDVATDKVQKKNGEAPIQRKRVYRRRSQEDSGTASDDEFDEDETDGGIQAGRLDAKIAAEHEERKSRAKTRENVLPGTNGATIKADEFERNQSTSTDREQQKKGAQFGGVSERERIRLLQHVPGRQEREGEREKGVQFAININLAVNVLLLAGKAIAVISSNSVSLIASLVDSALDLLSTVIIFGTSKAISYRSFHTYFKYPVGKKRFEPLGVVIFAVLMIASFCQVLVESVERLFAVIRSGNETPNEAAELPLIGIAFMVLTIIIKTFMWFIYRKSHSSGVRAVAQDAENDVVFNIASLIFPVIGSKLGWPALDPIGGVCLSIYIIAEWLETLTETITKLSGAVGSSQDISRALYLILRFRSVNSVSALEVYHAGDDMIVEADVVLPHTMALKEAHDAGEVITYGMELLSGIERAYIHLDYNPVGQAGHVAQRG